MHFYNFKIFLLLLIAILSYSNKIYGQQKKGLAHAVKKRFDYDTSQINAIKRHAETFRTTNNAKMRDCIDSIIQKAKGTGNEIILADAYVYKANYLRQTNEFIEANKLFESSMQLLQACHTTFCKKIISSIYKSKAVIFQTESDYKNALEMIQNSLKIDLSINDISNILVNENSIGNIYLAINDLPNALKHYEKITQRIEANNSELLQSTTYQFPYAYAGAVLNIGIILINQSKWQAGLNTYNKVLQLGQKYNLPKRIVAYTHSKIADVNLTLKNYNEAWINLEKAIEFHTKRNLQIELCQDYNIKANIIFNAANDFVMQMGIIPNNKMDTVKYYLNKSLSIAEKLKSQPDEVMALQSLAKVYEKELDFAKAHDFQKRYIQVTESLRNVETKHNIIQKDVEYYYAQKEDSIKFELSLQELKWKEQIYRNEKNILLEKQEKELQHLNYLKAQSELQNASEIFDKNKIAMNLKQKQAENEILQTKQLHDSEIINLKTKEFTLLKKQQFIMMFISLVVILGLLYIVYLLNKNRKQKNIVLQQNAQLQHILLNEMGGSLSAITLNKEIQDIEKQKHPSPYTSKMDFLLHQMKIKLNTIVWSLNTDNSSLNAFLNNIKNAISQYKPSISLVTDKQISWHLYQTKNLNSIRRNNIIFATLEVCNNDEVSEILLNLQEWTLALTFIFDKPLDKNSIDNINLALMPYVNNNFDKVIVGANYEHLILQFNINI